MTVVNANPETGIHYGVVFANSLDQELVFELLFGAQAVDHSFSTALECNGIDKDDDEAVAEFAEDYQCDEPDIDGELDGVQYCTLWLGGALHFIIYKSPFVTHDCTPCSPCVPCAGDLDSPGGGYTAYTVPDAWWDEYNQKDRPASWAV